MAAPLINQGTLNRALVSLLVPDHPELNVTSGFFGTKLARISFDGNTSDQIPTLTGTTPSPRLYQMVTITAYLNKSQYLASLWERRRLSNSSIGTVVVTTDSPLLPPYTIRNCVLQNVPDLDLTGESNDYTVVIQGSYPINNKIFGA